MTELPDSRPTRGGPHAADALHDAAFLILLAVAAARCFLPELPYQVPAVRPSPAMVGQAAAPPRHALDRTELARVTFAGLLLGCVALWLAGAAAARQLAVRHGLLAVLIAIFAAASLDSALHASNRRAGLNGWIEQVSLLAAGWLTIQLCADRRRLTLLTAVLAGVGAALAVKCLWQRFTEIPDRIADFEAHTAERLAQFGIRPDSPQARYFEVRLRDPSVTGFLPLANPFCSLMLVVCLSAAGLAVDKARAARLSWRAWRAVRRRGDVHLPSLAAALTALAALPIPACIILTRSKGGIISFAVAAAAFAAVVAFRRRLARHWRKAALCAAAAFAAGLGATVAYGLRYDRLPTLTMTFRWYYWTGSAAIVRDHPGRGVGPGNFATAYLRYRRPEAEEEVQDPHNVIARALAEYGLPGGLCYLGILGLVLAGAARPRAAGAPLPAPEATAQKPDDAGPAPPAPMPAHSFPGRPAVVLAAVTLASLAARAAFSEAAADAVMLILDGILPAIVLGAMVALMAWQRPHPETLGGLSLSKAALGCAAAGFVLHNMVDFGLFVPSAAGAFWLAAGACLADSDAKARRFSFRRWMAAVAAALLLAPAVLVGWPVAAKTWHTARLVGALRSDGARIVSSCAAAAMSADPLDPQPAADAANIDMLIALGADEGDTWSLRAPAAAAAAEEAIRRDPENPAFHQLAGRIAWFLATRDSPEFTEAVARGDAAWLAGETSIARACWADAARMAPDNRHVQDALFGFRQAVERDPCSARLRLTLARALCDSNCPAECLQQLREALRLDGLLRAESFDRLGPLERRDAELLRSRAEFLMPRAATRPGDDTHRSQ